MSALDEAAVERAGTRADGDASDVRAEAGGMGDGDASRLQMS